MSWENKYMLKFKIQKSWLQIPSKYGTQTALLIICLVIGIIDPAFFSINNLTNLLVQSVIIAVIACGMTFVIISGGIDLSVGSIVAFSGIVLGTSLKAGLPLTVSILISLISASFCGLINGTLVTLGKVPPFIATLGMMGIARGVALVISGGRSISVLNESFLFISEGKLLGIPFPIIIMFIIFLFSFVVLKLTYWGQYVYAIGGNIQAAWLSGIPIRIYTTSVYVLSGLLSGVGCIILTARLNSAQATAGTFYQLDAIAATVIGGASLMGGRGTITGTLFGALIITVLKNGLSILNVPSYFQQIAIGSVIVIAVLIDRIKK